MYFQAFLPVLQVYNYLLLKSPSFQQSTISRLHSVSACPNTINLIPPTAGHSRSFVVVQTIPAFIDWEVEHWYAYISPMQEEIDIGRDYKHWFVEVDDAESDKTRDEIIDGYIKTLATVVGSEEEAKMRLYSVSTRCYYAFGALVSDQLIELQQVLSVEPDSYVCVKIRNYGGEALINGQAVPYDPKHRKGV